MLLQIQEDGSYILSRFIMIVGFLVIVLGILLLLILLLTRKKQNELFVKQQQMEAEFQQQLLQVQIEVQETTFSSLGKELHDNIGQLLSTALMLLGITERQMGKPPDTLLTANATLSKAIQELRALSKSLDKEWLVQFNLVENLQAEVARINAGDTIQAFCLGSPHLPMKAEAQMILFRIVQEGIQNAIKHARPQHITIKISTMEDAILVQVLDDGIGLTTNPKKEGVGLMNMKRRTHLLGGTIDWRVEPGEGTTVHILIPLTQNI